MKVDLIGTGMSGATLTQEAASAVARADVLIGAPRMLLPYRDSGKVLFESYTPSGTAAFLGRCGGTHACVLLSGDTGFYSAAQTLLPALRGAHTVRLLCGISSLQYACARMELPWERMHCVSLHGREGSIAVHVRSHRYCFFLLDHRYTAAAVCERLCAFGLSDVTVRVGQCLGGPEESVLTGTAQELCALPDAPLAVLVTENEDFCPYTPCGIPDDAFVRSRIPMTKREIRALAVAGLCITPEDRCWDIGCGTGSVSVEMALHCPFGAVYAFDREPEAVRLTQENARQFGADNLHVYEGTAPACLPEDLPAPDKVFIGGSAGRLPDILGEVRRRSPHALVTVSAISLETLAQAQALLPEARVTQLCAARGSRVGTHTLMRALNPVYLVTGRAT
ncbi:MAG: precorrin-6Y C5,15-methyltransferase (decarboxylating) subunit CbiT [Oscillospiraceae bacterium]|nr:precorrin-6Y C5,15-methyltransferase (decarboxylating) subunit CbiT [Oscillospiraceae bacterium]